jgi:putative ABC transport system permease protein
MPAPQIASAPTSGAGVSPFYPLDLLRFALERLWQHRTLALWTLIGLTAAAALAVSLLLYVDAVNTGLLETRLGDPPFAFRYRYLGVWNGNISREQFEDASRFIQSDFSQTVGLPTAQRIEYVSAGIWTVTAEGFNLGGLTLGSLSGADALIDIVAGEWGAAGTDDDGAVSVLLHVDVFETMGVQVGDRLTALRPGGNPLSLRVAALWRPVNPDDPAWILPERFFATVMLTARSDLWRAAETLTTPVEEIGWGVIFDGSGVKTTDVSGLLQRIGTGERDAANVLPGIRSDLSPVEGLRAFNAEVERLTGQLTITSLPVGGLTLYFMTLVAGMFVGRQADEDAVLASRGMSRRVILFVHGVIWLALAGAAWGLALAISPTIVQIVGMTASFLRFDNAAAPLSVVYTPSALYVGMATVMAAASCGMVLSWRSSRRGVVQPSPTRHRRAWWQRAYLDLLLFIPAAYILLTLARSGGLTVAARDPFSDPLAMGAPTLFSLSLTLMFLRVYPFFLQIAARVLTLTRSIAVLMALREITRSIARYRGALLMMGFTLSLTGFTASMASTIDASLIDSINYQIGADAVLVPATDAETETERDSSGQQTGVNVTGFNVLPADDLAGIEGVNAVSRVGRYPAQIILPTERPQGVIIGVDRAAMAAVARYRRDYSETPLADLFNRLATNRTGVILNAAFARARNLAVGGSITMQINALGAWSEISLPIIGVVEYFPTLDPNSGFFALMLLDVVFETVGGELPYEFWLDLADDADAAAIRAQAAALGYPILDWRVPERELQTALLAPLRRGVLGFLSVGFIAAVALTLIGAVIQNAATFRAQSTQLGVLRAMGLGRRALSAYVFLVQGLAAFGGVGGGTLIGVATTQLYLPILDFSGGLPPYLVRVAWDEIALVYATFGGVLLLVMLVTTITLSRQSLSMVVKLGE